MAKNVDNNVSASTNKLYQPHSHDMETATLKTLDKSYLKNVTNKTKDSSADLPDFGTLKYPPLKNGNQIYLMKLGYLQPWSKAKIMSVIDEKLIQTYVQNDDNVKLCTTKEIAYYTESPVRFPVGTRVIAEFRERCSSSISGFYCGVIGEDPATINQFRYLVFFDNGNIKYMKHKHIRLVVHKSSNVSNDVHPDIQPFIKSYLEKSPVPSMVKLTKDNYIPAKYEGSWENAKVVTVNESYVRLYFIDLEKFELFHREDPSVWNIFEKQHETSKSYNLRQSGLVHLNKQFVGNRISEESIPKATCRKSSTKISTSSKNQIERNIPNQHILFETKEIELPKSVPRPRDYIIHNCNNSCVDWTTYDQQKTKSMSMLSTPLHFGFKRILVNFSGALKNIMYYETPCGRKVRNIEEMFKYLTITQSKITIDQFDFNICINLLNEFKVLKWNEYSPDLSCDRELKWISMVNTIDNRLPPPMVYLNSRQTMPCVEINLDSKFLCGCDCTDNCQNKSNCACWQLTIEGQKRLPSVYKDSNIGYNYRRLPERIISGIYECNKNCKCSSSCLNRVVQYPTLQKLQLFLTEKKGWGVRCLNDIPQGSFICNLGGLLTTEKYADERGMNFANEYLADLDFIEGVEKFKDDYESDLPTSDEEESDYNNNNDSCKESDTSDKDYQCVAESKSLNTFGMSLRKRRKLTINTKTKCNGRDVSSKLNLGKMKNSSEPSKSVREYFGANECVYILDAKTSGNIARYLNHSCSPNTFVQSVFVDTYDLRFPWISFFALNYIPAGTEITWDYRYVVGSVQGKEIKCQCESVCCRGRLL